MSLLIKKKVIVHEKVRIPQIYPPRTLSYGLESRQGLRMDRHFGSNGGQVRLSPLLFPAVVPDGKPE